MHPPQHHPLPVPPPPEQLTQTATIRNAVNLKKNSLRLEPVNGDSSRLAVHFDFDASEPCWCAGFPFLLSFYPPWSIGDRHAPSRGMSAGAWNIIVRPAFHRWHSLATGELLIDLWRLLELER